MSDINLRLIIFSLVFGALVVWELTAPRRNHDQNKLIRWPSNLGLLILDSLLVRLVMPAGAVGVAVLAQNNQWGVLAQVNGSPWVEGLIAVLALDFVIYIQHILFHKVSFLWRLHRVHHTDVELDVTSAGRFHPLEILLSLLIKSAAIIGLGASPDAVLAFEVILNAAAMFNHANIKLPNGLDRLARWIIVTPDMHRIHHSVHQVETDSNYGFNVPWWDRLFRTYRPDPQTGHEEMQLGLGVFRERSAQGIIKLLIQPFREGKNSEKRTGFEK